MRNVKLCVSLVFLVFILVSCAPKQAPITEPVVQRVMIQCWDGSIVESIQQCPIKEQPPVIEPAQIEEPPVVPAVEEEPVENKTIMQTLLEKTPKIYWFNDGYFGYIVYGDKRTTWEYDPYWNPLWIVFYWDVKSKVVYVQAWDISESWWVARQGNKTTLNKTLGSARYLPSFFQLKLTWDETRDAKLIPNEFKKYYWNSRYDWRESEMVHMFDAVYTKSPTDRMKEYAFDTPIKIDTRGVLLPHMGGQVMSKLAIYYKSKIPRTSTIVFYIDPKYNLPLTIDELNENGAILKRTNYMFDTTYQKKGKTNVPLTPKVVELPENHIIVSVADMEAWREAIDV